MTDKRVERRLAAILAADVVGYSRLTGLDEEGTHIRLTERLRGLANPKISEHRGKVVKHTGDGMLAEFASVVDAARCAIEVQRSMAEQNATVPQVKRIEFRIGIHVGDIIVDENDIFGDGVNIAARLEGIAEPGGVCISDDAQRQIRGKVDIGFDDLGTQNLKNIAEPMRAWRLMLVGHGSATAHSGSPADLSPELALPDKPSIAVLPFQNMSDDPEQDYFADGMVEEIITALSRIKWLFVIARNSSFTYKGRAVDVKQVGRELGVRYVLKGSVRKAGNRVRITGQLIDAITGAHLWAEHFDGSLENIFDLQDKVAISVSGIIEPALQAAETARSARRPTADLTAYDLYLRAYPMLWVSAQVPEALRLLKQAIARDPRYGMALAWAAICCYRLLQDGRSADQRVERTRGLDYAKRALEVAGDDPTILANAADALSFFGEDIGAMLALVDRALVLNPSYARGWHVSGVIRLRAGQPEIAIEHCDAALRLSPRARFGSTFWVMGAAYFFCRRFDEAAQKLRLAIQENPMFAEPYRVLAACYAHMGRLDDARDVVAQLRTVTPAVMPDASQFRSAEHRELWISGLRRATGETA